MINIAVCGANGKMGKQVIKAVNSVSDMTIVAKIDINKYVTDKVGIPTLTDIMQELEKPGRDPRGPLKRFEFSNEVHTIEDVKPGMVLPGIVNNITNFGAFVDIGVHVKGLIHISQLAPGKFIKDPTQVVSLQQQVLVKVLDVDLGRQRISLAMETGNS